MCYIKCMELVKPKRYNNEESNEQKDDDFDYDMFASDEEDEEVGEFFED